MRRIEKSDPIEALDFEKMEVLPITIIDNCYDCDCGDGCDGYGNDCVSCDNCDCDASSE